MKRTLILLTALATLAALGQVILETRITEVRRERLKTSVMFEYNETNGVLERVEIRTADVTTVDGVFSSRRPGPVLRFAAQEVVAAVPDFPAAQAGFNAWINASLTNATAGE